MVASGERHVKRGKGLEKGNSLVVRTSKDQLKEDLCDKSILKHRYQKFSKKGEEDRTGQITDGKLGQGREAKGCLFSRT